MFKEITWKIQAVSLSYEDMNIKIKKINTQVLTGNASGVINTYTVIENGKEFLLTRTSRIHGNSIGIAGKEGILYVDSDDNQSA